MEGVGSKTFDGVWFEAYSHDHPPSHVHGFYTGVEVIVELTALGVRLSSRKRAVKPPDSKHSDVNRILRTADKYQKELWQLWHAARGQ
ncbi:DUF4160 domain-containing protein [Granulicella sp. 5B5]|nr:DUF4160 domain-containing protein [Granulicella sp. 5B5]